MRSRSLTQHDWLKILNDRQEKGNFETGDVPKWVIRTLRKNKYLANNNVVTLEGMGILGYLPNSYGSWALGGNTSMAATIQDTIREEGQRTIRQIQESVGDSCSTQNTDPL